MISRSILTTIIGFLFGYFLYSIIDTNYLFIFLFGGMGYFIGLILDNAEKRLQLDTFHFTNIASSHEIFYSDIIPEAVVLYSKFDNITTILLDYKIEAKPEDYRLSVLKNLQEFDFRVIEDSSKTIFSLIIEYPEFNYPLIRSSQKELNKFFFDIKELGSDFQGAVQKIIPGLILSTVTRPDIFGDQNQLVSDDSNVFFEIKPPDSRNEDRKSISSSEKTDETSSNFIQSRIESEPPEVQTETEDKILADLNGIPETSQISAKSSSIPENDPPETDRKKRTKLLTADKIKEQSEEIVAFQDNDSEIDRQELEKEEEPNNDISREFRPTVKLNSDDKTEEGAYEIVEATLDESEIPLLEKITERIDDILKQKNTTVESDIIENYKVKGSSKQEI